VNGGLITTGPDFVDVVIAKPESSSSSGPGGRGGHGAVGVDQLIALSNLIHGPPTPQSIDKAKFAIDVWIRELETAKA
jgi:hypothetical protein